MPEYSTRFQVINDISIEIEEQIVSRQQIIPQQVNLEFNQKSLALIISMQEQRQLLFLSPKLLTNLRYYSLLCCYISPYLLPSKGLDSRNLILRSGLVFTTYYRQDTEKIPVITSNISLQGKISQQICLKFFFKFALLKKIINAHYWIINQILQQLPLNYQKNSFLYSWILPLLMTLAITIVILIALSSNFLIKAVVVVSVFFIVKFICPYLINKYLVNLFLQQLLFGFFSPNYPRRKLGFTILRYLIG